MLPAIKAFTREPQELQRYTEQVNAVMHLTTTQQRIYAALEPATQFTAAAAVVLLLWFASSNVGDGEMTPAELVSFLLYAALLSRPAGGVVRDVRSNQTARGTLQRLQSVLTEQPEPIFAGGKTLASVRGDIEFRNVGYTYSNGSAALNGIT